jgi:hypothetical protein
MKAQPKEGKTGRSLASLLIAVTVLTQAKEQAKRQSTGAN